jgi:hypothetical protein
MVPIHELPYGPAAPYGRITRPDRWQHPTTPQQAKETFCFSGGRPQMTLALNVDSLAEVAIDKARDYYREIKVRCGVFRSINHGPTHSRRAMFAPSLV